MYVYLKSEPNLWTVGYYAPNSDWKSESDWPSKDEAATRVNYLNGAVSRYLHERVARLETQVSELRHKAGITEVDEVCEQANM
jgi:hypothetical protein